MASTHPTINTASTAPTAPVMSKPGNFRDGDDQDSDASCSDQSNTTERSLSPTRKGLSKTKKRKERRQFGAFADELGHLLGAAFQSKDGPKPATVDAGVTAANTQTDGDLDMQIEPASRADKMTKRQRQNLKKMEARKLAKEQSKMVTAEQQIVAAERRGMTIQEYRGQRPEAKKAGGKSRTQERRARKEKERLRKKVEEGDRMDLE